MLLCVVPSTHQPMHIEDASILRNLWTFGSSDDGLPVRARIFEDIQMAPSEHFISRVASRKWHSKIGMPKTTDQYIYTHTNYILSIFTNIFLSLVPNTQTAESSRKKIVFSMSSENRKMLIFHRHFFRMSIRPSRRKVFYVRWLMC
jgi:hypothetical protein